MKTSVQTILLSLFALLITPCLVIAQSFSVAVTPNEQTVAINETATYSVVITPLNGFKATVFLSVALMPEFYGKITLSATAPNLPYSNITLSVTPTIQDTGTKTITITAKNGSAQATANCTISITKNIQWTTLTPPDEMRWSDSRGAISLKTDNKGDVCYATCAWPFPTFGISINRYTNKQWKSDVFNTTTVFPYYERIPFAFDNLRTYWFLTHEGVTRHDGNFSTLFNTSNSDLPSGIIQVMEIDKNGFPVLPILNDNDLTLARFDGSVWKSSKPTKPTISPDVKWSGISIDSSNRIWISSYGGGIIRIQDNIQENYNTNSTIPIWSNDVSQIICDKDGGIWCLSGSSAQFALSYFDGSEWKNIILPTTNNILKFLVDVDKNMWLSTKEGLYWYNGTTWTTYNKSNSPLPYGPREMVQDKDKNIWMVIGDLFYIFNPNGLVNIPLAPLAVSEQPVQLDGITISPNPTSTSFTISGIEGVTSMKILTMLGMEVKQLSMVNGQLSIDVSDLASGVYFVQFRTLAGVISKPIVVGR